MVDYSFKEDFKYKHENPYHDKLGEFSDFVLRDHEAEVECCASDLAGLREAMEDSGDPPCSLLTKDLQRVVAERDVIFVANALAAAHQREHHHTHNVEAAEGADRRENSHPRVGSAADSEW